MEKYGKRRKRRHVPTAFWQKKVLKCNNIFPFLQTHLKMTTRAVATFKNPTFQLMPIWRLATGFVVHQAMFWGEARNPILANEDIHKCKIYPHVLNLKAKGFKALPISTTIHHIKPNWSSERTIP